MTTRPVRIASLGDFCVDDYVDGGDSYLGGTAYNVAVQAQQAGAQASVLSAVGGDALGDRYFTKLNALNIDTSHLQRNEGATSRVLVRLDENKTPDFYAWEFGALEAFSLTANDCAFLSQHDAARSVLMVGVERQFEQFCAFDLPNTLKAADFAGGSQYSYGIDAVEQYAPQLDVVFRSVQDEDELNALARISRDYQKLVVGTMGKSGSIAFANGERYMQPTTHVEAVDTTGAGDAYTAYFLVRYLETRNIQAAMRQATEAAVATVLGRGASPDAGDEFS